MSQPGPPRNSSYADSAKRIEKWLSRERLELLCTSFLKNRFPHTFDQLIARRYYKSPKIGLDLFKRSAAKSKKRIMPLSVRKQSADCSINQKYPLMLLNERYLKKRCITSFNFKDHLLAIKKFKYISRETQKMITFQLSRYVEVFKKSKDDNHAEEIKQWNDLLQNKEERQFRIERITRFLT